MRWQEFLWGSQGLSVTLPPELNRSIELLPGLTYPLFRFAFIIFGLAVAFFLYLLITRTRVGMLIRAGASDREMVRGLGVNINLLFTFVFSLGAAGWARWEPFRPHHVGLGRDG